MATLAPVKTTKKTEDSQQAWEQDSDTSPQEHKAAEAPESSDDTISYLGEFQRRAEHGAREQARARKTRLLLEKAELEARLPTVAPSEYTMLRNRISDIAQQIEQCDLKIVDPKVSLGMDMDMDM